MGLDSFRGDDEIAHGLLEVTVEGPDGPGRPDARREHDGQLRPADGEALRPRDAPSQRGTPRASEEALAAIDRAAATPRRRRIDLVPPLTKEGR